MDPSQQVIAWRALAGAACLAALLVTPARADRLAWIAGGVTTTDRPNADALNGVGLGLRFASHLPVSPQIQLDLATSPEASVYTLTVGARLGTTSGQLQPWVEGFFGLSVGTDFAGGLAGFGVGATLDLTPHFGVIGQIRGFSSANGEQSDQLVQFRAGLFGRFGTGP